MDFLEFSEVSQEVRGAMMPGKLKFTDQAVIFKNNKTGKVEQISSPDIDAINWQRISGGWGLRVITDNGTLHRFGGFKESDHEKLSKFFTQNYKKDFADKDLSVKGWNWGTAQFRGSVLSFDVNKLTAFEVPLNNVSQCITGKNEVTLEFHQNDDAPVSLMEMRFFIPSTNDDVDSVGAFQEQIMRQASVITAVGEAIAIFSQLKCLTPRGRYDIKIYQSFVQLHGKTFDYKIPMSTILRLFLLPHKDQRQMFFVVSLDPPIKQGQTRYHFLILLFEPEEEVTVEIPLSESDLKNKYEGKLEKEISGPTYEVISKVMKALVNRKITVPGSFKSHSGGKAVSCSYKAAAGYLYPLERGFIYIHKPPVHIRFDEIDCINFARGGTKLRFFELEVELLSGVVHTFSSIDREEYNKLYDFVSSKKLRIKNRGGTDQPAYNDELIDSDAEDYDPYLNRVRREGAENDSYSGSESEDEDFKPGEEGSDVAEEYDTDAASTSESEGDDKSPKKKKSAKTISETPRKPKKKKIEREGPKRPMSAYFVWFTDARKQIVADNPGLSIAEIGKKGGQMWREMSEEEKKKYHDIANEKKEEYKLAMVEFKKKQKESGIVDKPKSKPKSQTSSSKKPTASPSKGTGSGPGYKSKEYISDDDSSSDDGTSKRKIKKEKKSDDSSDDDRTPSKKVKEEKASDSEYKSREKSEEEEEEEAESTPASSDVSGGDSD